jgi:hypothetical protein
MARKDKTVKLPNSTELEQGHMYTVGRDNTAPAVINQL